MNSTIKVPVAHVLATASWIKKLAYLIALIGTVASYGTQVTLLRAYEVGWFGYVIPATVDLLAICAALALQLPDLDRTSRRIAGFVLTVAVVVSVAANLTGGHNTVARVAHAWPVVAYLLGELLANRVRSFAARLVAANAPASVPVFAPIASPVVVATPAPAIAPTAILRRPLVAVPATAKLLPIVSARRPHRTSRTTKRPAIAATARRTTVNASVPVMNPNTGRPYSERHSRRLRNSVTV